MFLTFVKVFGQLAAHAIYPAGCSWETMHGCGTQPCSFNHEGFYHTRAQNAKHSVYEDQSPFFQLFFSRP
jgi:hypothetical protein